MIIKKITSGKFGIVFVQTDNNLTLNIPKEVFLKSKIKLGENITDEELENIQFEINLYKSNQKALNILSYRAHSKKELSQKIKHKLGNDVALKTVEKMEKIGLVNDKEYSVQFATHLYKNKFYATKRIILELSRKGINSEIISETIQNLDLDEEFNLKKIISKKKISNEKEKRRLINHLIRLGYSFNKINSILNLEI